MSRAERTRAVETPDVTVVVITRNRWPDLRESLPRHRCPVILLDNGSEDGTPAHVRASFPAIDVIELGRNLGAVARNTGVERATTPYVAFADDDSWWSPGACRRPHRSSTRIPGSRFSPLGSSSGRKNAPTRSAPPWRPRRSGPNRTCPVRPSLDSSPAAPSSVATPFWPLAGSTTWSSSEARRNGSPSILRRRAWGSRTWMPSWPGTTPLPAATARAACARGTQPVAHRRDVPALARGGTPRVAGHASRRPRAARGPPRGAGAASGAEGKATSGPPGGGGSRLIDTTPSLEAASRRPDPAAARARSKASAADP
ncbi:glycosyltransferase family 2 protein [Nocardioides panzhihuensis]|uniref:glycosyltransferase family 2 protein n=1 Tax=Nocardioides panzhihuensis TaxID=860243 RepID=UPI003CCC97C9